VKVVYRRAASALTHVFLQEDINFLVTNRIPRRYATLLIGWFSRIRSRRLTRICVATWSLFDDLQLEESQCALLLFKLSHSADASIVRTIGLTVLPIIIVAELACWFAVITLNHIGHAIEELLWSIMVALVAAGFVIYSQHAGGGLPLWVVIGLIACAGTTALIMFVDIPLYIARWRTGKRAGLRYLRIRDGLKDAFLRRQVTHAVEDWRNEVLWMSLYFSAGVWVSLGIVFV
jgi:hypothetical protein